MKSYAVVDTVSGTVVNAVVWDGETEWTPPEGCFAVETETAYIGWNYADGVFTAPPVIPPSPEEVKANNTSVKESLLQMATSAIAPLQDAVDLDDASDAETALLKKWKQYRVAVNRIDLTLKAPSWPDQPQ